MWQCSSEPVQRQVITYRTAVSYSFRVASAGKGRLFQFGAFCFTLGKIGRRKVKIGPYFVLCFGFFTFFTCCLLKASKQEGKPRPNIDIILSCERKVFLSQEKLLWLLKGLVC